MGHILVYVYTQPWEIGRGFTQSRGNLTPLLIQPSASGPCAVNLYRKYLTVRPPGQGPAFRHGDGSPLRRTHVTTTLHDLCKLSSLDASSLNTHSFRIGKATHMAMLGHSHAQIALAGRWKSNAYLKYIKPSVIHC